MNRFFFLIWITATAILYIFGNDFGTRVIFFASLILPVFFVTIAAVSAKKFPSKVTKFLPVLIRGKILSENIFTGEKWETEKFEGFSEVRNCGMIKISAVDFMVRDIFGLSAWKIKNFRSEKILIMPQIIDDTLDLAEKINYRGNSSENSSIREYRPGDSFKYIHWKLSNKTDKLLVREKTSSSDKALLLMEIFSCSPVSDFEPELVSARATALYNASHRLISQEQSHDLAWINTSSGKFTSHEINCIHDLDRAFSELLTTTVNFCEIYAIAPPINS